VISDLTAAKGATRRVVVSATTHRIRQWLNQRLATMNGFFDFMPVKPSKKPGCF
jgi:hypothetical protein